MQPTYQLPISKRKLLLVGTLASLSVAAALLVLSTSTRNPVTFFEHADSEKQLAFMQFLARYGKTYATKSDVNSRFDVFSRNYDLIKSHNEQNTHFQMEVNKFTDMTPEEFEKHYLQGVKPSPKPTKKHFKFQMLVKQDLPEEVDWHLAGKVSEPQDQSSCGSCWAFTTAATLESALAIKKNTKPERLSVQYLVDCDPVNLACQGGWMLDAYDFTKKNGIVRDSDYPHKYGARQNKCEDVSGKEKVYNDD